MLVARADAEQCRWPSLNTFVRAKSSSDVSAQTLFTCIFGSVLYHTEYDSAPVEIVGAP